jgi:RNA polymerase sigma factor (sigma-70 family)
MSALRAYPRLESRANLRGWLLRIAQRKAIDAHRARSRRPVPVESVPETPTASAAAPLDGANPELWERVRALTPKQRVAVISRAVLGLPYAELAQLLDCSEEAARRSLHEGLKRLREEWTR